MKLTIKAAIAALVAGAAITLLSGCALEMSPYEINNAENYTVSVKFDANGGTFTTNTSVIVDSFNISELPDGEDGDKSLALITPDDENRGHDAFKAELKDHFLAGWYAVRTESKDSDGNTVYTYSQKWDFENGRLSVNPDKEYSAEEPILTLYAAWVPLFEVKFHSLDTGEYIQSYFFTPTDDNKLQVPAWDKETGAVEMYDFPKVQGYTFNKAYLDADGKKAVKGEFVTHPGTVDYENGTAKDSVLSLYIDWKEGDWYKIYTAEQFLDNASLTGHYEILADLDFADEIWPTSFMYGNFEGEILGNGHKIKNVSITQTNNSKVNAGLFGNLTDKASVTDVTFENVTFTVKGGTRVVGASFGLFAGTISDKCNLSKVQIKNSTLLVDSSAYFGVDDYSIGLVCGMGNANKIKKADIKCESCGNDPDSIKVSSDGNDVTVTTVE